MFKLVDDLNVNIVSDQPGYINETVNIDLDIEKKSPELNVKSVSVFVYLYEKGQHNEIVPGVVPKDMFLQYKDS